MDPNKANEGYIEIKAKDSSIKIEEIKDHAFIEDPIETPIQNHIEKPINSESKQADSINDLLNENRDKTSNPTNSNEDLDFSKIKSENSNHGHSKTHNYQTNHQTNHSQKIHNPETEQKGKHSHEHKNEHKQVHIEKQNITKDTSGKLDAKTVILTVAILGFLFLLATGTLKFFDNASSVEVITDVDTLHELNINGDLDESEGYFHNDFSFVYYDGLWWTEIIVHNNGVQTLLKIPLHYTPKDLESISQSGELDPQFDSVAELYLAIDPSIVNQYYALAISELSFNIAKGVNRKPLGSCTTEGDGCTGREIISCDNNPDDKPVIELEYQENSAGEVIFEGTCVKIVGGDETIVKAAERMLMHWYQIMPFE